MLVGFMQASNAAAQLPECIVLPDGSEEAEGGTEGKGKGTAVRHKCGDSFIQSVMALCTSLPCGLPCGRLERRNLSCHSHAVAVNLITGFFDVAWPIAMPSHVLACIREWRELTCHIAGKPACYERVQELPP